MIDTTTDPDQPGFANPVADAQACFRAVLTALSRPGSLHAIDTFLLPPAPLDAATAAVLLTLADPETPLALGADLLPAAPWIAFHCGAPIAALSAARFIAATILPDLTSLDRGSDEAPEDSATIILQVAALGHGTVLRLTGPGLATAAELRVDGLPSNFVDAWHANHALYPRGIDLILCAGTTLTALPRTVAIEAA